MKFVSLPYVAEPFAEMVPPPAGLPAPTLWGNEQVVRERFGNGTSKLTLTRHMAVFDYPFSPKEVVGFFRQYFGPTQATFSRLDKQGQYGIGCPAGVVVG